MQGWSSSQSEEMGQQLLNLSQHSIRRTVQINNARLRCANPHKLFGQEPTGFVLEGPAGRLQRPQSLAATEAAGQDPQEEAG